MKKGIIAAVVIVSLIGLTIFGFKSSQKETKSCNPARTKLPAQAVNLSGDMMAFNFPSAKKEDIAYTVRPKFRRSVTKEELRAANAVSDLIEHYPSNWIDGYKSVEIIGVCNGKELKAIGKNADLTEEQVEIFKNADTSTDVAINISYLRTNSTTKKLEDHELNVSMTLTPATNASYADGLDALIRNLKEKSLDKIDIKKFKPMQSTIVTFTINEEGNTENVQLEASCGDDVNDQVLIDLITKEMPQWNPAKDSEGVIVKQVFQFLVGDDNC